MMHQTADDSLPSAVCVSQGIELFTFLWYADCKKEIRCMENMKQKKRLLLFLAAAVLLLSLWIAWGNTALQLTTVTVSSAALPQDAAGLKIAHISDLHNAEFGKHNENLLALLVQAQPDLIAITGDLVDSRRTDLQTALDFAAAAVEIAPCFYVPGNHESRISAYPQLRAGLEAAGVTVLENAAVSFESLTLLGALDPAFFQDSRTDAQILEQALSRLNTDGFTVLLSHRPELFSVYAASGVELSLSGHAHGGQVRLPLLGGVIAPHQGFFPTYDAGLYTDDDAAMVVSRGLGNSLFPFRVNNRPEVVLVQLQPDF